MKPKLTLPLDCRECGSVSTSEPDSLDTALGAKDRKTLVHACRRGPTVRVWWHFHETIIRKHHCKNLDELLDQAEEWFRNTQHAFYAEMNNTYTEAN